MSKNNLADFIENFRKKYGDKTESVEIFEKTRASIIVKPDYLIILAEVLRDDYGFIIPIGAGAIDYPEESRMQMIYYLNSPESDFIVVYRINIDRDAVVLPSMTQVWEAMSFHERETHEMFGIGFKGHPDLRPLLLPDELVGKFPMRKSFVTDRSREDETGLATPKPRPNPAGGDSS